MSKTKAAKMPKTLKNVLIKTGIWEKARRFAYRERKVSFGKENPDKIIYIIRRFPGEAGLFSYILTIIARIDKAIENGWIPVVDMQNYFNSYITEEELGKVNAWEYYFEQPAGVSLEEAYHSKNVILSDCDLMSNRPRVTKEFVNNKNGVLDKWRDVTKQYLIFNSTTRKYIEKQYKKLVVDKSERMLGIIVRGTDYTTLKPKGHAIQPDIDVVIEKAKEVMQEYNCNKIFLATEDKHNYDAIIQAFGEEKVLCNQKQWVNYNGGLINTYYDNTKRERDRYWSGLEYLTTIYILSRCNCIIGGTPGGAGGAMILSEDYEYIYFWFLGCYK